MKEAYAITGYVAKKDARDLAPNYQGQIQVKPERGNSEVVMSVSGADIVEVRKGADSRGETLVQLILKEDAAVQTIVRSTATAKGLQRFNDPALARLTAIASVKVIMI